MAIRLETRNQAVGESNVATELSKFVATVPEPALRDRLLVAVGVMADIPGIQMESAISPNQQKSIVKSIFGDEAPPKSRLSTIYENKLFVVAPIAGEAPGKNSAWTEYRPKEMLAVIALLHVKGAIEKSVGHELSYQVAILETVRQLGFAHSLIGSFEEGVLDDELINTHREETNFDTIIDELEEIYDQPDQTKQIREFIARMVNVLTNSPCFPVPPQDIASMTLEVLNRPDDENFGNSIKTGFIRRPDLPDGIELDYGKAYYPRDLLALWLFLRQAGLLASESGGKLTPTENIDALREVISLIGEDHPIALRYNSSKLSDERKLNKLSNVKMRTIRNAIKVLSSFFVIEQVGTLKMEQLGLDWAARQALFEMWQMRRHGGREDGKTDFVDLTNGDLLFVLRNCLDWMEKYNYFEPTLRQAYETLLGEWL